MEISEKRGPKRQWLTSGMIDTVGKVEFPFGPAKRELEFKRSVQFSATKNFKFTSFCQMLEIRIIKYLLYIFLKYFFNIVW